MWIAGLADGQLYVEVRLTGITAKLIAWHEASPDTSSSRSFLTASGPINGKFRYHARWLTYGSAKPADRLKASMQREAGK
jgi:hypothetical protein